MIRNNKYIIFSKFEFLTSAHLIILNKFTIAVAHEMVLYIFTVFLNVKVSKIIYRANNPGPSLNRIYLNA